MEQSKSVCMGRYDLESEGENRNIIYDDKCMYIKVRDTIEEVKITPFSH